MFASPGDILADWTEAKLKYLHTGQKPNTDDRPWVVVLQPIYATPRSLFEAVSPASLPRRLPSTPIQMRVT
jgi:hypothetical protein